MAAHRKSDQNRDDLRGGVLRKRVRVQKSPITSGATLTAQQAKELKALTATLKEQASQIQKVSDRLKHLKPTKKDLMISKIISGAACLAELTSNPKSFYNCPDLHGGNPGLPRR
jgi:uncharacterized coiled-coil protein SlyX